MNDLAKNLVEYRKKAKLTQPELASKSGVSQQSISVYEKGERKPKYPTLSKLSKALNCHPDDLDPYYQYSDIHYSNRQKECPLPENHKCPLAKNASELYFYIPAIKELEGLSNDELFKVISHIKKIKEGVEDDRKKLGEEEGECRANTA